ncbi:MAG: molybdopterin molybdotransferase MoeA [Pseudomonadota bacterium]
MLTLQEAQEKLLALAPQSPVITPVPSHTPLPHKAWLAKDHQAKRTQPAADLSAMDGYAICGEGPWQMIGESRAGAPFADALKRGQCTRISTGAHMPEESSAVLIQENARVDGGEVNTDLHPDDGNNVRRAGFDFRDGETVLTKGTPVTPATMALAIAAGFEAVDIVAPPSVAILDSGDELVPSGAPCGPHQIPASNGAMLGAMLHPLVGITNRLGPVPDDPEKLNEAFSQSEQSQILITSGGASVGDHDLIQPVLKELGATIDFWRVAIKPGKPLLVATRELDWGRQIILGLPGNPVSSFVTAFLFALPLVRKMMGASTPFPNAISATAGEDLPAIDNRQVFLRGELNGAEVTLASSQDSSALKALAIANCLIRRPAHSPLVKAGESVPIYLL